jgi:hypothetical protein
MRGRLEAEDLSTYTVVYPDRVCDVFAVSFEPYI